MRSPPWLPWFLLLANILASFVFFGRLYEASFTSMNRFAIGIMLAALPCPTSVVCPPGAGRASSRLRRLRSGWPPQ